MQINSLKPFKRMPNSRLITHRHAGAKPSSDTSDHTKRLRRFSRAKLETGLNLIEQDLKLAKLKSLESDSKCLQTSKSPVG
ncbi:hypothetical protein AAE026_13285 [Bradyrhizobium sp. DN5]|uniref:hypothetical protein n=1 Tax=Bradyrhizobium sp. DN5 TaxID=3056950 RepID=UPI0035254D69